MSELADNLASIFKAYDVRGRVPSQLDAGLAEKIGRAFAAEFGARHVAVGRDVRPSSDELATALAEGLNAGGCDVMDIGLCGTEEVYFATFSESLDGGIMVTASHNPQGWNGLKFVREGARPVSGDEGLDEIRQRIVDERLPVAEQPGTTRQRDLRPRFVEHLLGYIDTDALEPLRIVTNAGNGGAGVVVDALEKHLPFEFVRIHHEPDGSFPNGIPNPLLPENRDATAAAVREHGADLGVAWDGDFDRCFLFDETGAFIEGYYMVGLLATQVVAKEPGARIIHDPRLTWNTVELVREGGGEPVQSKTGHAFIKARMRKEDAAYGGEMSAHHYFRDFGYCDSGMIPWLLAAELIGRNGRPLSDLVAARQARYPCSGEINRRVVDPDQAIRAVRGEHEEHAVSIDETDGLSLEFGDWRFNLRKSNTEPVLRLNVESRGDRDLMEEKTRELLSLIDRVSEAERETG